MSNGVVEARGATGQGWARAAETLLRTLGGGEARLLLPVPSGAEATTRELGMGAVEPEAVSVAPVVVRAVADEEQKLELVLAATTIDALAEARQFASGEALLKALCGVVVRDRRLRVEHFTTEYFGGMPYLHRLTAR